MEKDPSLSLYADAEGDVKGRVVAVLLNERTSAQDLVQLLQESFRRNDSLCRLVEDPGFIQSLPHFRFIQQSLLTFVPANSSPE